MEKILCQKNTLSLFFLRSLIRIFEMISKILPFAERIIQVNLIFLAHLFVSLSCKYTNSMNQDTLQAKQTFVQKVYDAVEAYLEANDCTIYASDGVYVDAQLEPTIMNEADAEDPDRFYPLCSLIREDEETIEADKAMVEEIAELYFV